MNHPNWRNRELALQKFYQLDEEKGDLFHNEEVEFNDHQLHQTKSLQLVLELLHDEHTRNRIHAMRILWLSGVCRTVTGKQRMIFDQLASMINDSDADCRLTSCLLTAALPAPEDLVLSTLTKKKNVKETQDNSVHTSRITDPGDMELSDSEAHEMSAASYGSFIHASEDEFVRVRLTVIDSIFQIALQDKNVARLSLKFLIDMFNDEEALVRRTALQYVSLLMNLWKFLVEDEDVDLYILAMKDNDPFVKSFSHKMHSSLNFKTTVGFEKILNVIIGEINENEGSASIEALAALSKNHAKMIDAMVPSFFGVTNGFLPKEFSLGDATHRSHLVMVFNAASILPSILGNLPKYVVARYDFIKSYYNNYIPVIIAPLSKGPDLTTCTTKDLFIQNMIQESSKKLSAPLKLLRAHTKMLERCSLDILPLQLCKCLLQYHASFRCWKENTISSDIQSFNNLLALSIDNLLSLIHQISGLSSSFQEFSNKYLEFNKSCIRQNTLDDLNSSGVTTNVILTIPSIIRIKMPTFYQLKEAAFLSPKRSL